MNYKFKPSHIVPAYLFVVAVLYGGSKPPSSTNEPPSDISSPTNTVGRGVLDAPQPTTNENAFICGCGAPGGHALPLRTVAMPQQTEPSILCSRRPSAISLHSIAPSTFTSLTAWNTRGAYCDWVHITFPGCFEFPYGTNMLTDVTVMAWGEVVGRGLRSAPETESTNSIPAARGLAALPMPVSLEPDASSFIHGLTPSNSYLFTWSNVCVNRSPTNRVDASIELFDSGAYATTVTRLSTPTTTDYAYHPAVPPAGFIGEGQDDDWLATAFPSHYAAITNGGYSAWLSDYIGYNEPNGRYKVSVTVSSLPDHGPCYLVIGPYKMVVTAPGTYSFPLEVFNEYRAYTCPTRVPLSFSYDDGYDYGEVLDSSLLMMSAPPLMSPPPTPDYYIVCMVPNVYIVPSHVPLSQAVGTHLGIYCNYPSGSWDYFSFSSSFRMAFSSRSDAEIEAAEMVDRVVVMMSVAGHECSGVFYIDPPPNDDDPPHHQCCNACCGDACRCDRTCCLCNCGCHSSSNSNTNTTGMVP